MANCRVRDNHVNQKQTAQDFGWKPACIKNMCCNQFGERNQIQSKIDILSEHNAILVRAINKLLDSGVLRSEQTIELESVLKRVSASN